MTREEAVDVLKHNYPSNCYEDLCKAVDMAIKALQQPEPCEGKDTVSKNVIIQKLNTMDRYVSEELRLCNGVFITDKKFPKNEVFIVDDVYEEIVENLPYHAVRR